MQKEKTDFAHHSKGGLTFFVQFDSMINKNTFAENKMLKEKTENVHVEHLILANKYCKLQWFNSCRHYYFRNCVVSQCHCCLCFGEDGKMHSEFMLHLWEKKSCEDNWQGLPFCLS